MRLSPLIILSTCLLIAGVVKAQPPVVSDVAYDGWRWMLTGRGGNALLSYNGSSFLSLSVEGVEGIWGVAYDENLGWAVAAYAHDGGVRPHTRLLRLEGEKLVDLGKVDIDIVSAIEGNGRYWLIAGLGEKNAKLIRFSGGEETNIGSNLSYLRQPSYVEAIAWAPWNSTWLIGGATLGKGWIVSYDGEHFADLSQEAGVDGLFVRAISCNKAECLIFVLGKGRKKLIRYSPEGFSDLTERLITDELVTGLTWTGSYWVLTTPGGYIIYDGGNFTRAGGFPALGPPVGEEGRWLLTGKSRVVLYSGTFLSYCSTCYRDLSVEAGLTLVRAVAPFGGGWLIATSTDSGGEAGSLTLLKGNKASLLYRGKGVSAVACRRDFCLAGGKNLLLEYNGTLKIRPINATIAAISWYGKGGYWLLGAEDGLLSYEGGEIKWISREAKQVSWIACSDYCLIASDGNLLRFNGTALEDITGESGVKSTGSIREVVTLDYGGGYWLIGGNAGELNPAIWEPFLIKYDGSSSELLEGYAEGTPDTEYGSVLSVRWNGKYFLVYTNKGKLFRYDGKSFENLTNRYTMALKHTPNCLAWNGSTWLMGGGAGLLAYDGRKMVPLHERIKLPFKPPQKSIGVA
ncbi:MAG: hypothetical protein GXO66_06440, partial [Euryarchaeota archaeon]|nr:hypothetical protein [Euryarchaeota archaeon]